MIDFHCPAQADNDELVSSTIAALAIGPGYLVESGESYHFYGLGLLSDSDLPAFLGKILLLCPIVDRAWVAHQLMEGVCALRVSPRSQQEIGPTLLAKLP